MRILILLLLLLRVFLAAAQSLLPNGGFEEENICTEFTVNCAPEAWLYTTPQHPYYFDENLHPRSGNRLIGVAASGTRVRGITRGYVRCRLLCGLRKGARYRLQLYVRSTYSRLIDSMGVRFSPDDFLCFKGDPSLLPASLYFFQSPDPLPRRDTGWARLAFDYTARGDEAFLTLGNFAKMNYGYDVGLPSQRFMVYFDDISLLPLDPAERLCSDWKPRLEEIYSENDRHQYQQRHMYTCQRYPPGAVVLPPTRIITIDTLIIPDVLFATNSAELNRRALLLLDSLTRKLPPDGLDSIVVEGHTDSLGTLEWNQELSENRARSVGQYLEYGLHQRIITRGWGPLRPVAPNRDAAGRKRNRRVEIYVYRREQRK